jgi:ferredoxin--NADP+ reductase
LTISIAIVGAGPAGYYTAEAAQKKWGADVRIDLIDRLPTPFGLIRAGVAPDHQSIKAVTRRYEATNLADGTRLVGNVMVGRDVSVGELLELYDAVVLSVGAPLDRELGIPGEELAGVLGSAAFVGWYNGHPDHAGLEVPLSHHGVAVIGNGNVAIDCARVLAKTPAELATSDIAGHALSALEGSGVRDIHIVGRRGPHQASFTTKEAGELGHLERAQPLVRAGDLPPDAEDAGLEPGHRKMVQHLRGFAAAERTDKPVTIHFEFFRRPVAIEGHGRVERLIVETTRLEDGW